MWNWLTRRARYRALTTRGPPLRLEVLESREVPAILIQVNYTYDNGFLANNPQARATLQEVATQMGNRISANLSAIVPSGSNTWSATLFNPQNGALTSVANMSIAADTVVIFVGARALGGSVAGEGGFGGYSASGSQDWENTIQTRGWSGFSEWGGSLAFDNTTNWYFGQSASGLASNQTDFYSVAEHEMGHVLGIGTSTSVEQPAEREHCSSDPTPKPFTAARCRSRRTAPSGPRGRPSTAYTRQWTRSSRRARD